MMMPSTTTTTTTTTTTSTTTMAFIGFGCSTPPVIAQRPFLSSTSSLRYNNKLCRQTTARRPARFTYFPSVTTTYPHCLSSDSSESSASEDTISSTPSTTTTTMTADNSSSTTPSSPSPSSTPSSSSSPPSTPTESDPTSTTQTASTDGVSSNTSPTTATTSEDDSLRIPAAEISEEEAKAFRSRYNHLRGADVETVSDAMQRFTATFRRPVPIVYRTVINETISTTHLARVCPMWRYDAIFALGFDTIFSVFLKFYPNSNERDQLYDSCATALKFDAKQIRSDAESIINCIEGLTELDIFKQLDETISPENATNSMIEAMIFARDAPYGNWYYSRLFGIGLIRIMASVNTALDANTAEKWADKIGVEPAKFGAEMGNYLSGLERLKQAEQIFAEATAREAKKTAERLAAKAKKAAEEAAMLESGAAEGDEGKSDSVASDDTVTNASNSEDSPKA